MSLVKLLLKGNAKIFFDQLDERCRTSLSAFQEEFLKRFKDEEGREWKLLRQIWSMQQKDKQTASEYMDEMERVAAKVGLPESQLIQAIVSGLNTTIRDLLL